MISAILTRSGGPPAAALITSADSRKYCGPNQWVALQRFVEDGRLAIDNNAAENQLRGVALGRKNWLFAGSLEGAKRSCIRSCKSCALIDVPPVDYLKDVLLRVATYPHRLISELTPRGWAATAGHRAAA
jgi:transposase